MKARNVAAVAAETLSLSARTFTRYFTIAVAKSKEKSFWLQKIKKTEMSSGKWRNIIVRFDENTAKLLAKTTDLARQSPKAMGNG